MHRQGRSPKGSGLFVFMGRAAEGMGTVVMRPFVRLRPAAGRREYSVPFPVILFMVWSLVSSPGGAFGVCGSVYGMAAGDDRHGRSGRAPGDRELESRKGRLPLGIWTEETAKNNGAPMGKEAVMIVLIFTINGCKAHFYHRKSSKRDISPEIIAKACIIR